MDLLNYQYLDKMNNNNIGILCYEGKLFGLFVFKTSKCPLLLTLWVNVSDVVEVFTQLTLASFHQTLQRKVVAFNTCWLIEFLLDLWIITFQRVELDAHFFLNVSNKRSNFTIK